MRRSVVSNKVAALRIAILLALVALTISGVIVATVSATETRSLTSSADTQIVENAPTKNYGATTSLGVNENDQSSIGKDKFALVKWDLSRIAPRTQINSASVTLNVTNSSTETYQAYVLKKPWVESEATWNVYSSGEPWEVAGAKGSLDKEATVAGSITPSIKGKNTLTLPLAVVQGWVDNPDTNQGIIIAYPSSTRGFNFNSREDTDPTRRPQLILDLSPDTAPPETTIDSGPPGTISSGKASFDFSSTELGSSFECKLDSGTYESCTSPNSLTDLSDGSHTFSVKATDEAGNTDPTPADFTWTVDTTPPETTIDSGPSGTISVAEATFAYSSEDGSTFECSLNGAPYSACTAPKTKSYTKLSNGSHTFDVRATDGAGNVDATPAFRTFSVEVPPPPQGTTPPETTIDSGPSGTVSTSSADFSFSATEDGSTFECSLDGSAFEPCSSPQSYTDLSEGSHTFSVRTKDATGNTDPTPADRIWTVDTTTPEATIDIGPADGATLSSGEASFTFSSNEAGSTLECSLDRAAYTACTSPKVYTDLSEGSHTFSVRAKDAAGNTEASPPSTTWTVDTTAPEAKIDSNPNALTKSASASFDFSSTELGSSFECKLDSGTYESCTSPNSLTDLSDGSHTFSVRAKDQAGNVDQNPASYTWTIDTLAPNTTIDSKPNDPSNNASPSFSFSSNEANSTFECSLDGAAFTSCTSPKSLTGLSDGSHTFSVKAMDTAGNVDGSPATYTWNVDTVAPETTIDTKPTNPSNNASPSFGFSSNETGSGFQCKLDSGTYGSCTSPKSYSNLSDGSHTFSVRAKDASGNTDASPASTTWTVDTTVPQDNRDTDGDGLQNWQDTCPDEAGPSSNDGCPNTTIRENVVDYGATPNDSTNDTNAFKSAMDATGVGEVTYVPSGAFRVANVNIPSNTDVEIESSAVIKKFGTTAGPLFRERGPTDTTFAENIHIEGVGGNFTLDTSDAGQETAGVVFQNVRDFSLKNAVCIQNNDNMTQQAPSSRRPCLSFLPTTSTPSGGTYNHPTNGLIENVHSLESPFGWGLVQTTGGESLTFTNISSEGGSVLRLENYSNGWTPMKNITATDVTCTDGHNAVMFNPHGASHLGGIHVRDVVADSCEEAVSITGDGTYGPDVSVDGVEAIPGLTAQVRDPDPGGYVGAWLIGPSPWCVVDRGTYPVSISNLSCGGLPNR